VKKSDDFEKAMAEVTRLLAEREKAYKAAELEGAAVAERIQRLKIDMNRKQFQIDQLEGKLADKKKGKDKDAEKDLRQARGQLEGLSRQRLVEMQKFEGLKAQAAKLVGEAAVLKEQEAKMRVQYQKEKGRLGKTDQILSRTAQNLDKKVESVEGSGGPTSGIELNLQTRLRSLNTYVPLDPKREAQRIAQSLGLGQ
jgi:hypothetical protein